MSKPRDLADSYTDAELGANINTANAPWVKTAVNAGGDAPIYACRAWVNFNGTLTTPITPRASGNVSSIIRHAAGQYTINFATAMEDADYSTMAEVYNNFNYLTLPRFILESYLSGSVRVEAVLTVGGHTDSPLVLVSVFR